MRAAKVPLNELRRVVIAASVGNIIEWYDFYIFGSLASILAVKFFEKGHPVAAFLSTVAIFSVGFLIRPLGAFVFGWLGDKVGRGMPAALHAPEKDLPMNRLGLAKWLLNPSHPLTARVAVNRFWQQCFGTGIVKTSEDFGLQSQPPSHPELLDYLASQFIADGWDVKTFMKRLVMSATYRQSSRMTPELVRRDPDNRLLARGPRYRLDAEMVRDQILYVSGLLVEQVGGLGGDQVHHDEVAVRGGALDVDQGGEPLTQRLDLLLDVGVGQRDVLDLGLDAVVRRELDLRADVDLGGELQRRVVLELGDLDLGLRQRLQVVGLQRLDVLLREHVVDRLVEDGAATDLTVDHGRRDLAAAEAGDVDLLGNLLVRSVEARLELLEGHLDGQLGPGRAQGLDGALHRSSPSVQMDAGGAGRARVWSGRQDSNLRSPAPKAGALATTLRPAKWGPRGVQNGGRDGARPYLERMTGIEPA